ncbi:MAG: YfcC family protein [Bacteroidales bacterium]|nr:YfcC family protein [Bacteroidales bacterium]
MFKKVPHTYVIIFSLIVLAAIATWFVPAGEFIREAQTTDSGKVINGIVPGSYHHVEQTPQTWQIMSAFFKGFQKAPGIIAFLLILGGAFWILNETKAIDMGVQSFLKHSSKLDKFRFLKWIGVNNLIIILIMIMFSAFGAIFGMSEETIAFVIIFVPLAISMGYDSIVGVCMCFLAAGLGFAGCILNPFTLGIAQDIAGIKMFSGIEYRLVMWVIITSIGIAYVLWYANKVKKNPSKSIMYEEDNHWRHNQETANQLEPLKANRGTWLAYIISSLIVVVYSVYVGLNPNLFSGGYSTYIFLLILTVLFVGFGYKMVKKSMQMFSLFILIFTIIYLIVGVMIFEWGFVHIAALFFTMAIITGIALGKDASEISKLFIEGARDMLSAALVVGLASGIIVILEDGKIIDTFLNSVATSISGSGEVGAISLMYGFQSILNAVITSGTAKAAMLMPMFREIAIMTDISLQSAVTAFHIGDGFTNLITPTSGVLIAVLGIARIPYAKWVKWSWKFILAMVVLGWILLIPTVLMDLPGF